MRRISFLALVAAFCITSCQKTQVTPSNDLVTANSEDQSVAVKDRTALLCAHTWMYYKYYIGYVDPNNLGTLAYKRGGNNNTLDLDNDLVTYHTDGTVDENIDGSHIYGTWSFADDKKTKYVVTNPYGTFSGDILRLSNTAFVFVYTDVYGVNRAGYYVPFSN